MLNLVTLHEPTSQKVKNITILRCWFKLEILPSGHEAEPTAQFQNELFAQNVRDVDELEKLALRMNIQVNYVVQFKCIWRMELQQGM